MCFTYINKSTFVFILIYDYSEIAPSFQDWLWKSILKKRHCHVRSYRVNIYISFKIDENYCW